MKTHQAVESLKTAHSLEFQCLLHLLFHSSTPQQLNKAVPLGTEEGKKKKNLSKSINEVC